MVMNSAFWGAQTRVFHPRHGLFGRLRTHSSLPPLQKTAACHPQIAQRKQRHQVGRVLGQARFYHEVKEAHLAKIIKVDLQSDLFTYNIDEQALRQAQLLDGKLLLVTLTSTPNGVKH